MLDSRKGTKFFNFSTAVRRKKIKDFRLCIINFIEDKLCLTT